MLEATNDLVTLAMFSQIPLLMLVAYRGYIGEAHSYHATVGRVTEPVLRALGIQHVVVDRPDEVASAIARGGAARRDVQLSGRGPAHAAGARGCGVKRIDALRAIADCLADELVVCNQGGNGQDWHQLRPANNFYMQHSMGLTTALALGLAMAQPDERIWAFEGDGGMLMSLGMLGVIARARPRNLKVLLFDNENHECGGPYPTLTRDTVDLAAVALACGWDSAEVVRDTSGTRARSEADARRRRAAARSRQGRDRNGRRPDDDRCRRGQAPLRARHRTQARRSPSIRAPEHYSTTF